MADPSAKVTVHTVAEAAQVSAQTVSRVLGGKGYVSEATRARVMTAIDELGYRPSAMGRSLRAARTPIIAFMIADITNPFYARIYKSLEPFCRARGLTIMLLNSDDDPVLERQQLDLVASYNPTGLIISPSVDSTFSLADLKSFNQAVFVSRILDQVDIPSVITNETEAMAAAAEALAGAGHRSVLAVLGQERTTTTVKRERGVRSVFQRSCESRLSISYTDQTSDGAHAATIEAFKANPGITGIIGFNSQVTEGILVALRELRLDCPDDVSVVGFTDAGWMAFNDPPITVISQPVERMGELTAQLLLGLVDGQPVRSGPHVVPSTLLERASVAVPRLAALPGKRERGRR